MVHDGFEMEDDDAIRPVGGLGTGAGLPPVGEAPVAEGPGFFDTEAQLLALGSLGGARPVERDRNPIVPEKLAPLKGRKRRLPVPAPADPKLAAAAYVRVPDWRRFQNTPSSYIQVHAGLLDDYKFSRLSDAEKLQVMLLWLFAARCGNLIPADEEFLSWRLATDLPVELGRLIDLGFLEAVPLGAERRLGVPYENEAEGVAAAARAAEESSEPEPAAGGPTPGELLRRFRREREE